MGATHAPLSVRVWRHLDVGDPNECWPWTGTLVNGYGTVRGGEAEGRKMLKAHRVVYELLVGPIPEGHQLDHECHNRARPACRLGRLCPHRACCNPLHLTPKTPRANVLAGQGLAAAEARQDRCKRGHDLTDPANLKPNSRGARQCRACVNLGRRERYARTGR